MADKNAQHKVAMALAKVVLDQFSDWSLAGDKDTHKPLIAILNREVWYKRLADAFGEPEPRVYHEPRGTCGCGVNHWIEEYDEDR